MAAVNATYRARVEREGQYWVATVPDIDGAPAATQAQRLSDVDAMVRDMLVSLLEVDPADIRVELDVTLPPRARAAVRRLSTSRARAESAAAAAAQAQRSAAAELVASGLSVRDAGSVLGLSHQRVSQLTRGSAA